ncbi:GGDEF domain-containing protein [Stakelama marina]|uniref:diguanylate cyclase n=1 Tax=Stakelama marina TaxID=2826939 RepID=A0A8T4IEC3_9SPHN|nr:diguanylate cyclase [Stakelama marina]MBR0552412.1 diguanylate cyclase [Stakelama marina]
MLAVLGAVAAALLLLAPTPARASGGVVGEPLAVCVLRAEPGMTARNLFATPSKFDCQARQRSLGPGDYWVISQPLTGLSQRERRTRVRIASLWQKDIALYALYPDGRIREFALTNRQTSWHIHLGAIVEWGLPDRVEPPVRLLWRVRGAANLRGIVALPRLALPRESERANLEMGALYAGFGGLCVALLIYNLAMWGALRYRFQLAYCAMVASLGTYAVTSSGALAWLVPNILNNDRLRLNYILLAVAASCAMLFARMFFERSVTRGWTGKLASVATLLLLSETLVFAIVAPWNMRLFDTLYSACFALMLVAMLSIVFRARQLRSPYLWLFALAWSAPVAFATMRMLSNIGLLPWSFWLDNSTILSMSFEAVMSTLAIAYRIRLISQERDEAKMQEMAARMLADTDPLTGLLNRRSFLAKAMRTDEEQKLLLIDLDHFKRVNETIGHDGGDEVLRIFARTLRLSLPPEALIARIGGEEFAAAMPSRVAIDVETLLASIRSSRMPFDIVVTASVGTCRGPLKSDTDWKHLYRNADRALFAAKSAGRDRVRRADQLATAA